MTDHDSNSEPDKLLARLHRGDVEVLGSLLEQYRNYLKLLARLQIDQRLQAKVDSSDVVQEVFFKAHRYVGNFRGTTEGEFLAWLRQILATTLTNMVRRYLGQKCRDVRLERQLAGDLEKSSQAMGQVLVDPGPSPSHLAAQRERAVLLADSLELLPEHYREVLVLRHLEGKTFVEIASAMGKSVGSVEKLWIRGLARMRLLIKEES